MQIGQIIYAQETLVVEQCYKCQCFFAMPQDLRIRCKNDNSREFWCPNGHPQIFSKSENSRLKEQIQELERKNQRANDYIQEKNHEILQLNYSVRAQKAAKTKIMNRVKNGVCPCCNRTFQNLQNHFKTVHPELIIEN